ncbi:CoA pyrophosphatase [Shewanella sp. VB17]|uniref:CoA pyrophosphatase n=1 Tax=Shewanella sp. VB17 TaxID=2739432 RepID=UPI001565070A|nr:CoA pyrophosphatase [Shewanella sp. VB17]NRD74125.1 CoA pyrophosphatase [Shewanella sp. VB17]
MNLSELRVRYNVHPLVEQASLPISTALRQAAVLIAFTQVDNHTHVILTRRPMHLRNHPGQVSFPGGKVEQCDLDIIATALREAEEEIALKVTNVEILGQYPKYKTFTGFEITPVLGIVKNSFVPVLDEEEVADFFTVPLSFLLNQNNRLHYLHHRQGIPYTIHFIPFKQHIIWGATAAIIEQLCQQLTHE